MNDVELYRRYTTRYYCNGYPHPLKAPDEIRRRIKKTHKVWHSKMKRALAYAEKVRGIWIEKLQREEKYLRDNGWTTEPFEHEEFMGDHDTWISPRDHKRHDLGGGTYISKKGDKMSRCGAMSMQCAHDGHVKPINRKGPYDIPLTCCARCGAAFAIGHDVENYDVCKALPSEEWDFG